VCKRKTQPLTTSVIFSFLNIGNFAKFNPKKKEKREKQNELNLF
jgi:hypothetical protein